MQIPSEHISCLSLAILAVQCCSRKQRSIDERREIMWVISNLHCSAPCAHVLQSISPTKAVQHPLIYLCRDVLYWQKHVRLHVVCLLTQTPYEGEFRLLCSLKRLEWNVCTSVDPLLTIEEMSSADGSPAMTNGGNRSLNPAEQWSAFRLMEKRRWSLFFMPNYEIKRVFFVVRSKWKFRRRKKKGVWWKTNMHALFIQAAPFKSRRLLLNRSFQTKSVTPFGRATMPTVDFGGCLSNYWFIWWVS